MAKNLRKTGRTSRMVSVAPNEMRARQGNESNAEVRARYAREQRDLDQRISRNQENTRFFNRRDRTTDPAERTNLDIARAVGQRFSKGGLATSKRGDGVARKGKTKGRFV